MKRLALAYCASVLAVACGPRTGSEGTGGTSSGDTGGSDGGGTTGGASSGGAAGAGDGGTNQSGGGSAAGSGGSDAATGGEQGSTGGSPSIEPGSALDSYFQAGQPKVVYVQQIFGDLSDFELTFEPQMLPEDDTCDWSVVGACAMVEGCLLPDIPSLDAGTMTLTAAGQDAVSERVDGTYESSSAFFDPGLGGGEPLVFSAAGGADLPAFELETTFPLVVLVDSPAGDLTAPIPVPTTTDLTVEFRRASGNVVLLLRGGHSTGDAWREILCAGAGDPGSLVVPQEALAYVGPGVELNLYTAALESVQVGDQTVNFEIVAGATNEERMNLYKLVTQ